MKYMTPPTKEKQRYEDELLNFSMKVSGITLIVSIVMFLVWLIYEVYLISQ